MVMCGKPWASLLFSTVYQAAYPFSDEAWRCIVNMITLPLSWYSWSRVLSLHNIPKLGNFRKGVPKLSKMVKYGFIMMRLVKVIHPNYEVIGDWFEEGLVLLNKKINMALDKSGNIAIRPQFDSAKDFQKA